MKRYRFFLLGGLMLGGLLVFSRIIPAYFVSDDWDWLWQAHQSATIFPDFFANAVGSHAGGSYNPVSSLWINTLYHTFGLTPQPYHIASIVLHSINAWLVALLFAMLIKLFAFPLEQKKISMAGAMVGILFLVWPTHVEAVAWIASVPHLLATFFYLLAIILYIRWKMRPRRAMLFLALATAMLSFLSKEIALTLPLVLLAIEIAYQLYTQSRVLLVRCRGLLGFFIASLGFLVLRYTATGLLLGTYADAKLIVRPATWVHTFLTFFEEMFMMGLLRREWSSIFFSAPRYWAMVTLLAIVIAAIYSIKKRKYVYLLPLFLFVLSLVPFIPLGFNRLNADGERYTYLPSVFFILFLGLCLVQARKQFIAHVFFRSVIILSIILTVYKTGAWARAGMISMQIIDQYPALAASAPASEYIFVALPDTIDGAHVFRNSIAHALMLRYAYQENRFSQVPVYTLIDHKSYAAKLLDWRSDDQGYLATSPTHSYIVTGVDRVETDRLIWELWHYDYTIFSSDTIRLIFEENFKTALKSGASRLITWNNGKLELLPY